MADAAAADSQCRPGPSPRLRGNNDGRYDSCVPRPDPKLTLYASDSRVTGNARKGQNRGRHGEIPAMQALPTGHGRPERADLGPRCPRAYTPADLPELPGNASHGRDRPSLERKELQPAVNWLAGHRTGRSRLQRRFPRAADAAALARWRPRSIGIFACLLAATIAFPIELGGLPSCSAAVELPEVKGNEQISLSADHVERWRDGDYEVLLLTGHCEIRQGPQLVRAARAVVWVEQADVTSLDPHRLAVYVEQQVVVSQAATPDQPAAGMQAESWFTRLSTYEPLRYGFALPAYRQPQPLPDIVQRATARRSPAVQFANEAAVMTGSTVQPAQFDSPFFREAPAGPPPPAFVPGVVPAAGPRRVRVFPRAAGGRVNSSSALTPDGRERVTILDSGINIIIEGIAQLGVVDIATDRAVIWSGADSGGLSFDSNAPQGGGSAVEIYMEGNIVFRQADRIIYAESMYYNVREERGVILNAELLAGLPGYQGAVRLKADVLRQVDSRRFQANQAALTTSRMGVPRYWFQSGDLRFEDQTQPLIDPLTGQQTIDPLTGELAVAGERLATSRNNVIYLGKTPVFYWPTFESNLTQPTTYVSRVRFGNDRIFGTQLGLGFDLYQLFGLGDLRPRSDWTGSIDYLGKRGWGLGTTFQYDWDRFLSLQGPTRGFLDAWGLYDNGLDNLGRDRNNLLPEANPRGRVFWQHRQLLTNGIQVTGELGYISDRNFLEQFYEREWDQWKDEATGIELKYLTGSASWNISTDIRINPFVTETEWLPRIDHYQLGEALFQDRISWFGHNHAGYAKLRRTNVPTNPGDADTFNYLRWEVDREGIRAGARHELDLPLQFGAFKFVPYVLGEVIHWGEDINGDDVTRLLGQAGVRASLPMWSVDPTVRDELFQLNGLAHKIVYEAEFFWSDASLNLTDLPLYDQLDDNSNEHFRRRFPTTTFGGAGGPPNFDALVPIIYDERFFAFRNGMQSWVTAPSAEIADDLTLLRLRARQRWQTKRGLAGQERIVDWMTLDMEGTLFPKSEQDFGASVGVLNYDWRWHVGDRVTIMSDGYADTFAQGLRMVALGGYISRPERGSAYMGFRSIEGPLSANVLTNAISYRMSPKWVASIGSAIDLSSTGNIGQIYEFTRIGESFLVSMGVNIDRGRDNVGFNVAIEPRFLPVSYRGLLGGVAIPPAGAYGLE